MDCLSYSLREAKDWGAIQGMKVSKKKRVTHLMFVDDPLFEGTNDSDGSRNIHQILLSFSRVSCLIMSNNKSILIIDNLDDPRSQENGELFGITTTTLNTGIHYLVFHLKANNYCIHDWDWLLDKYNRKLTGWASKWLTLGGNIDISLLHPSEHIDVLDAFIPDSHGGLS